MAWKVGGGAFGDPAIAESGMVTDVGTDWKSGELWLRKAFLIDGRALGNPRLYLRHSGPVGVSVNGGPAEQIGGATSDYVQTPLAGLKTLHKGRNTLAVHCISAGGPDYMDLGIVDALLTSTR